MLKVLRIGILPLACTLALGCAHKKTDLAERSVRNDSASSSERGIRLKYSELQIKDYDEMQKMIHSRLKEADKSGSSGDDSAAIANLREAMVLILSRPNQDNMVSKLTPEVRKELVNQSAFTETLENIVEESLRALDGDNSANLPVTVRSTYLIILENFISEFKPDRNELPAVRALIEKIRDAKIEVSKDVQRDLKMRSMLKLRSPSDLARGVIGP